GGVLGSWAAALAGFADAPPAQAALARPTPHRASPRPAAARGLGRPHVQPYGGIARRGRAAAAGTARGRVGGWEGGPRASSPCARTRLGLGARLGARAPCARK